MAKGRGRGRGLRTLKQPVQQIEDQILIMRPKSGSLITPVNPVAFHPAPLSEPNFPANPLCLNPSPISRTLKTMDPFSTSPGYSNNRNEVFRYGTTSLGNNSKQFEPPSAGTIEQKQKQCGTSGREIQLKANHFPMQINIPNGEIYHYDVVFQLPNNREVKRSQRAFLSSVIEKVKEKHKDILGNPYSIVFDGLKNIYSNRELFKSPFECKIETMDDKESPRLIEVGVKIKRVGQSLQVNYLISEYLKTGKTSTPIHDSLQVLNIILGMTPLLHFESVGRTHFNPCEGSSGSVLDIGHGKSIWVGTFQSVRIGWKPLLNVAMANRPAYNQQGVLSFLLSILDRGQNAQNLANMNPRDKYKLDREIRQLKVRFTRPDGQKREYRVNKIMDPANRLHIDIEENGQKNRMTIQEYFRKQYNYELKYPSLPCIHVGSMKGTIYIPLEFLEIKKQLAPTTKALSEEETSEMIQQTALKPDIRVQRIERNLSDLNHFFSKDPYANAFGLKVNEKMIEFRGRVLSSPSIKYRKSGQYVEFRHGGGKWNMVTESKDEEQYMFLNSTPLERWGVLDLAGISDCQQELFVNNLAEEADRRGQLIDFPIYGKSDFNNLEDIERTFKKMCQHIENQWHGHAQLIMVIAPKKGNVYPCLKYIGDAVLNVPTQFVMKKNVVGKPKVGPSYQTIHNICLKLNAKTGGTNHGLFVRPPVMKKPIIILGADVTHSSPSEFKKPSIAAMVGSCNPEASQYFCEVRVQKLGKVVEEIEKTEEMVYNLLFRFYQRTGHKPLKIVYYRDGVSEGQFLSVLNHEVTAIRKACTKLNPDYKPELTFLVAQKRHNTRLFTVNPRDGFGKARNIPPGTVADREITHPTETDFFLASHEGIQGTSKPTHYHLLWDDSDLSMDELQNLTYNLCYLCSRCERSVSYPAPTYYAHLAAARAREHHNALLMRNKNNINMIPREDLRKIEQCTMLNYFM